LPYRIDISSPPDNALDVLVQLGALDVEAVPHGLAAIMPDGVAEQSVAAALAAGIVTVSAAVARDDGSVWLVTPRAVRIGDVLFAPAGTDAGEGAIRLMDSASFGTGHHPTTALCVEALEEILMGEGAGTELLETVLDVGTGSGILALTALRLGVRQAVGVDIDAGALEAAAGNARLNHMAERLQLLLGGPEVVQGNFPLVLANVLAAPLIEMAPALVRRVGSRGRLILSGIPWSLEGEVRQAYEHVGMRQITSKTRAGWTMLVLQAGW
jgi:ribosomal protein L11 methyltransferase